MTVPAHDARRETVVELPYHRLLRAQPTYRWWRPLAALGFLVLFVIVVSLVVTVLFLAIGLVTGVLDLETLIADPYSIARIDATSPFLLLLALVSVAVWLPCVSLALLAAGIRPAGVVVSIVNSVTFRLRWGWLARCLVPSLVVTAVSVAAGLVVSLLGGDGGFGPVTTPTALLALQLALILLFVPFQAAAEEFVFRGVLFQAIGSWLRSPVVAIAVTTVLFALGHLQYDVWGIVDVGVFGVAAAIITWRTGGLEAAIALHAVNNVVSFALLASGVLGTTTVESDGSSPLSILVSVVTMTLFVIWVDRLAKRRSIEQLSSVRVFAAPTYPPGPGIPAAPAG